MLSIFNLTAFFDENQDNVTYLELLREDLDEQVELILDNSETSDFHKLSNSDILDAQRKCK